jgi:RNA polymerase sigma-70 factor (ECF subfamily)
VLPTGLRAVVSLRLMQGLSTRETAACLRLSETNVKVSLHRARQMLAAELGARWGSAAEGELRGEYAFEAERCDRVVEGVFRRISDGHQMFLNGPRG